MMCSRPEPHIKAASAHADCTEVYLQENIELDEEGQTMLRIPNTDLREIQQQYRSYMTRDWPTNPEVIQLAN
jgi:hypothetical protein